MAIPEAQLDTWSHQGSITNSANTGNSVKTAIKTYNSSSAPLHPKIRNKNFGRGKPLEKISMHRPQAWHKV